MLHYQPRNNSLANNDPDKSAKCELNVPEFVEKALTKGAKPGDTGSRRARTSSRPGQALQREIVTQQGRPVKAALPG